MRLALLRLNSLAFPLVVLAAACGESNGSAGGADGGTRSEDWAVSTLVQDTSSDRTGFMHLVDSPGTERLDLSEALEVGGNARLYILDGTAYIGSQENRSIVRTRPGDVALEEDAEPLSFLNTALGFLPSFAVWVSPEEAFLLDAVGGTAYGWNPTEMTLGREIDISAIWKEGINEPTIETAVVRDGKVFFVVQQVNTFTLEGFLGVQMGIIDIESGTLASVIEDTRCVGTRSPLGLAEDGTIYVQADNYGALQYIDPPAAPPTCILRIQPDAEVFDPSWKLDMPDLCDGRQASQFIYAGNGLAYVSVPYEEDFTIQFEEDPFNFFNQAASRWWVVDVINETGEEITGMPFHSVGGGNGARSDGRVFLFSPTNRFEGTTPVWEVDLAAPAEAPTQVFDATGGVTTMGRLRD